MIRSRGTLREHYEEVKPKISWYHWAPEREDRV